MVISEGLSKVKFAIKAGSMPKTMMNDVLKAPINDFENKLGFTSEETLLDSGLPSHHPLADVCKFLAAITSSSLIFSSGEWAQFSSPGSQMI
jgi:hypothetical protein